MAGFALKIKTKTGQSVLKTLTQDSTVTDLKKHLSGLVTTNVERIQIRAGFPPKPVDLTDENATLKALQINSGDTLIVEEGVTIPSSTEVNSTEKRGLEDGQSTIGRPHTQNSQLSCPGMLIRKPVPADNSCLFTSFGFVLGGKVDVTCGSHMRKMIAEIVSRDPETFSEAILGKPNREYCEWIQKPDSWGGAIELAVLANEYGIEIAVVDTLNAIVNRFGEDKDYPVRVFLIFDGIHYDPLYLETFTQDGDIQTMFPSENVEVLDRARELAVEAQSSRQFTDVNKFTLKCLVCQLLLKGQLEAQQHAKETGHMNYGEVPS